MLLRNMAIIRAIVTTPTIRSPHMLHEVLKAALSNASLGPTELSRRSGVPIATVFRLLNGTNDNPKLETLTRIATALNTSVSELLAGSTGTAGACTSADESDYVTVRSLDLRLSAGPGAEACYEDCQTDKMVLYSRSFFQEMQTNPAHVARMRVSGHSMEPLLAHGDYVLVDLHDRERIVDLKVYAIRVEGEYRVKRLCRKLDGTIILISDNPKYEEERLTPDLLASIDFKIIGRVIERSGSAAFS